MILTTADHQPPFFPVNIYQDVTRATVHCPRTTVHHPVTHRLYHMLKFRHA